jgi:TPR repeat protein
VVKPFLTIVCITFLLVFTVEAATLSDAKMAIRTQNFDKAVSILKPLAKKGDKQAQYQLAVMYSNGQGTAEDPAKAAQWMMKSARQGYKRAQYSMGVLYEEGTGVKKDRKKAIYWYSAASKRTVRRVNRGITMPKSD